MSIDKSSLFPWANRRQHTEYRITTSKGIDNRMMYTVGAAAKSLGLLDSDIIIGIPLSVTGKNPYFDRG